jgi:hypothetical protein
MWDLFACSLARHDVISERETTVSRAYAFHIPTRAELPEWEYNRYRRERLASSAHHMRSHNLRSP